MTILEEAKLLKQRLEDQKRQEAELAIERENAERIWWQALHTSIREFLINELGNSTEFRLELCPPIEKYGAIAQLYRVNSDKTSSTYIGTVCLRYSNYKFKGSDESPEQDVRDDILTFQHGDTVEPLDNCLTLFSVVITNIPDMLAKFKTNMVNFLINYI